MIDGGTLGLLCVLSLVFFGTAILLHVQTSPRTRVLIITGLWLRVLGALAYLYLVGAYYGGGDFNLYYREGLEYADLISRGGMDAILQPWLGGRWWGTYFVVRVSGLLLGVIGPTLPGAFIAFAIAGYVGILALWGAFGRAFPQADRTRALAWMVLFPSLWFWPAALGKDALVLCGTGLAVLGFVGRRRRPNWLLMAFGLFLVFCIRPQVAAVLALSIVAAYWLGTGRGWNLVRIIQGAALVLAGVAVLMLSSGSLGVELFDPQQVDDYLDSRATVSSRGGSALGAPGGSHAPWFALMNTLFRPFPWEAHGITSLLASIEVVVLWALVWYRWRESKAFVRANRGTDLFWLAAIFVLVYATALGMSISNIGIIARQRVHILPFIFMLFAGDRRVALHPLTASRGDPALGIPEIGTQLPEAYQDGS
jgi:hypothetical protein